MLILVANGFTFRAIFNFLSNGPGSGYSLPSPIPGASFVWGFDSLTVIFLLPICLISSLSAVYGLQYWKQTEHPDNGRKMWFFFGLLTACMETRVVAQSSVLFLFAWEGMAISAFFLVSTEDQDDETRNAGWLFLGASHFATLCLFAMFRFDGQSHRRFWMGRVGNVANFVGISGAGSANGDLRLSVARFRPQGGNYAAPYLASQRPCHGSQSRLRDDVRGADQDGHLRSGADDIAHPAPSRLVGSACCWRLGSISGILALAFAIGQRDLKRLLAYSSIENIGIITIGLGLALVGRALGQTDWVVLGMGGALLHVWNHACFKSMLFFCSGSIMHATHTRQIDLLGGLAKLMPRTSCASSSGPWQPAACRRSTGS